MRLSTNLESIFGGIYSCPRCHVCTFGPWPENQGFCPIFERGQTFTASAGGILHCAKAVLGKRMDYNQAFADLAFTCSACGACDSKCVIPRSINPDMAVSDMIRLIRYELVKRGFAPAGPVKKMYEAIQANGDLPAKEVGKAVEIPREVQNDKANTLFVLEPVHTDGEAESLEAAFGLLEKMGKKVNVLSDAGSYGSTLYDFGLWDHLPGLVEKKWKAIKSHGNKKLLFFDPHTQEFITKKYRLITDQFSPFRGVHFSELLLEAFNKGNLQSKEMRGVKASYHDPCFLGRGLGIYDAPRKVLGHVGAEIVEMKRNREQSFCCGSRGVGNYFENFASDTAKARIKEFRETKADILITACSHCKDILGRVMGAESDRVKDLTEFVNERTA